MLLGAAGAGIARGQEACGTPTPANAFDGVIGGTGADSKPSPLTTPRVRAGAPNIIYIVLDDTGFSDLHCYGSGTATPNIDALAAGGLFYNSFHCKAVCSPSRASLLTGRNSHAVGMKELAGRDLGYPNSRGRITPAAATIAQILASSGYNTMGVGKWHLTPDMGEAGPRTHWPLQKGFNRWYGFLSGWTDQYHPDLLEDNHHVERPNRPDYHFSVDIIDHAIQMIKDHQRNAGAGMPSDLAPAGARSDLGGAGATPGAPPAGGRGTGLLGAQQVSSAAQAGRGATNAALGGRGGATAAAASRPFFLYTAFGAAHAPVQVPKSYIDKYVPRFEKGWDQVREERYRRQLELGIIPPGTKLPPRNPGDPAWADLSDEQRKVYTRFMAAYAGFIEHADEQIGRLVNFLKEENLFDNTVIVLLSDNGGAPEAGVGGSFDRPYGGRFTLKQMAEHLDDLGGEKSEPLYQRPWAMTSDTPFKYYKLWPYRGGVQTPFIVSWPAGIRGRGLRKQFVDIIDITPTMLEIAGVQAPSIFDGVCQIPMQGTSIRATFDNPDSPSPHTVQYFELWGSRGIYQNGWEAIGIHKPGTDYDTDKWELYHTDEDFSQSTNLASQNPAKLEELKKLWWSEAAKNGALPLQEAGMRGSTYNQALQD
jgi:arylsulfatase